jgi:hypothetical protein
MRYAFTIFRKVAPLILVAALFGLLACEDGIVGPGAPYNAQLDFYQIDYDVGGEVITDSAWGSVDLTYDGSSDPLYFNLTVNDTWVIQNVPVLSFVEPGERQTTTFDFNLGVEDGTEVTSIMYDFDLTADELTIKPSEYIMAIVDDGLFAVYTGKLVDIIFYPLPDIIFGGKVIDHYIVSGWNSPKYNQNTTKNAGIWNVSLRQYLTALNGLKIDTA